MKPLIIDNFLDIDAFQELQANVLYGIQWKYNENIDYVSGVVEDFGYFGNLSIFRVRTANGDIIQVSKQNRVRIEDTITWEDQVYLSWEPESLIVLDK